MKPYICFIETKEEHQQKGLIIKPNNMVHSKLTRRSHGQFHVLRLCYTMRCIEPFSFVLLVIPSPFPLISTFCCLKGPFIVSFVVLDHNGTPEGIVVKTMTSTKATSTMSQALHPPNLKIY